MTDHTRPSIAAVLARYGLDVSDRTGWRPVRCPFHDDRTASAAVNTDLGAFNCMACGVKGDAYKLLMERENIGFREALLLGDSLESSGVTFADGTQVNTRLTGPRRPYRPPGRRGRR